MARSDWKEDKDKTEDSTGAQKPFTRHVGAALLRNHQFVVRPSGGSLYFESNAYYELPPEGRTTNGPHPIGFFIHRLAHTSIVTLWPPLWCKALINLTGLLSRRAGPENSFRRRPPLPFHFECCSIRLSSPIRSRIRATACSL